MIYLIRGLPGSGKTTYAKNCTDPSIKHIEADMWHSVAGIYRFDMSEVESSHRWCVAATELTIRCEAKNPVVTNTLTTIAECAPYYVLSQKYGVEIRPKTMTGTFGSVHEVPLTTIEVMRMRYVSDENIKAYFSDKDLSSFFGDPYGAYKFFYNLAKVVESV